MNAKLLLFFQLFGFFLINTGFISLVNKQKDEKFTLKINTQEFKLYDENFQTCTEDSLLNAMEIKIDRFNILFALENFGEQMNIHSTGKECKATGTLDPGTHGQVEYGLFHTKFYNTMHSFYSDFTTEIPALRMKSLNEKTLKINLKCNVIINKEWCIPIKLKIAENLKERLIPQLSDVSRTFEKATHSRHFMILPQIDVLRQDRIYFGYEEYDACFTNKKQIPEKIFKCYILWGKIYTEEFVNGISKRILAYNYLQLESPYLSVKKDVMESHFETIDEDLDSHKDEERVAISGTTSTVTVDTLDANRRTSEQTGDSHEDTTCDDSENESQETIIPSFAGDTLGADGRTSQQVGDCYMCSTSVDSENESQATVLSPIEVAAF